MLDDTTALVVSLLLISVPTFVTGAVADHLTPWKGCYRTTQLLSGPSTFVLSYSGHIQSLVNPPGNPRASYWTGGEPGPDPPFLECCNQRGLFGIAFAHGVDQRQGRFAFSQVVADVLAERFCIALVIEQVID